MLDFIYKYGEITEKEFYLMIHCEGNNEMLHRYVTDYRIGNIDIDIVGVNNTYQYTKKLLLQADIIFERNDEKKLILNDVSISLWQVCKTFHVLPNDPLVNDLSMLQINWILANLQNDAELMKKEVDKISKKPGTSVVQASTSDKDFEQMVKAQVLKIKKSRQRVY